MPEFLAILRPTRAEMLTIGPTESEIEVIGRHFAYMKLLVEQGVAILVGRTQENTAETLGLYVFQAGDEAEAWRFVKEDPAVAEGIMAGELRPFKVALKA